MTELRDEARAVIELARDAGAPGDEDRARIRAALAARLGAAAGLGLAGVGLAAQGGAATGAGLAAKAGAATAAVTGAGVTGAAATAGTLGLGAVAAKVVGAAVLVSMTVGVGATVIHRQRRARAPLAAPAETEAPPRQPGREAPERRWVAPEIRPQTQPDVRPELRPELRPDPRPVSPPAAPAASERAVHRVHETRPAPSLAEEAGLLNTGVMARRSGQPGRALELFDRHALLYPRGVLAEERDAERALALADLGRVADARAAIQEFLRVHPASPLAARLRERERQLEHAGR